MKRFYHCKLKVLLILLFILFICCEAEKRYPPKGYIPNEPKATNTLEAQYFWTPQDKINSSYWNDASYVKVPLKNIETQNHYDDGYLNMTGTYYGLADFNKGNNPELVLKAGYDNEFIYILVEWKDTTTNASFMTWKWDGPEDELKTDSTSGWTSQKNNDNVTILFDLDDGSKDAWKWSLAYTAPFDMALNLSANASGIIDSHNTNRERNGNLENSRSGPEYEWKGDRQDVILSDGSIKILDPAYYLLDTYATPISGDIESGQVVFNSTADCKFCHGINGSGEGDGYTDGGSLNGEFINKYTREGLEEFIRSPGHEGSADQYLGKIRNDTEKMNDLLTFMRGIAGVPGFVLTKPEVVEIHAVSNITVGGIEIRNSKYQVLFRRKLISSNTNDIIFSPSEKYMLSIYLSDNDDINYIGAEDIELIFKSDKL